MAERKPQHATGVAATNSSAAVLASTSTQARVQFPSMGVEELPRTQSLLEPQLSEALAYLSTVKAAFKNEPDKYATFLGLLKAFQTGQCVSALLHCPHSSRLGMR